MRFKGLLSSRRGRAGFLTTLALAAGASCGNGLDAEPESVGVTTAAVTTEDGLADAFALFSGDMAFTGLDSTFFMGAGYHAGLSTERVALAGLPPASASVQFRFSQQQIFALLSGIDTTQSYDLWLVKNVAGSGRTVKPETGDTMLKVGSFSTIAGTNARSLTVNVGTNVNFDLDMVVVTRAGQSPTASRVLVGSRTVLEKRLFRARNGLAMDPVTGSLLNTVETADPLVQRGAYLFFNETFAGNGRTCGTCHRAEDNLTIDSSFIATLPSTDPLFVYNSQSALAQLENGPLLTGRGLVLENVDGFSDPTHKLVMRGVPHLFGLAASMNFSSSQSGFPLSPPDQRVGFGGDGAPGRGTLNEMTFGAIIQHFTKTLQRVPGTDFRIPTQEELDSIEAFMLFSGRQRRPSVAGVTFREAAAETGRQNFFGNGLCTQCHRTMTGAIGAQLSDAVANTGVNQRVTDLPLDDGFGQPATNQSQLGVQRFDAPPLIEAADTNPLFHNNSAATIEDAVAHYDSAAFKNSPGAVVGVNSTFTTAQITPIATFLRELNAAENVRRMRKNATFVRDHRGTGNTAILTQAIRNCDSALRMLREKNLNATARSHLSAARTALVAAQGQADDQRTANLTTALTQIASAKAAILTSDPNGDF